MRIIAREINMNLDTKKIAVIFIVGIIILSVLAGLLLFRMNKNNLNQDAIKAEKEIIIIKDGVQDDVKSPANSISYNEENFSPEIITIKKGQNIEIKNLTDKKINMKISGPIEYQMPIEANKELFSPLFTVSGAYFMYNSTNSAIKAQLLVTE